MPVTQSNRAMAVASVLGADALLLRSFSGSERLGRLFEYHVELLSEKGDVDFNAVIGTTMTLRVPLFEGTRYVNGFVASFTHDGYESRFARYHATLVPWYWMLTRSSDCRIWQDKSIPDIIKEVLGERGMGDYEFALSGTYTPREYCVQYRETDFSFLSRLMEQEGIYYFFEHENGKHKMVIADGPGAHKVYPKYDKVNYSPQKVSHSQQECAWGWQSTRQVQTGKFDLIDFDFKSPLQPLTGAATESRSHPNAGFAMFDYPGQFQKASTGDRVAKIRLGELQANYEVVSARSDARGIACGCKIKLADHPRADQNQEYLIIGMSHRGQSDAFDSGGGGGGGSQYECSFDAIPAKSTFRPARVTPKPVVSGPQTAIVSGPSGEEIHTDEFGRVQVVFFWDRRAGNDKTSCWMRVAQSSAGKGWGAVFLPRVGQEVIVEFLEGDPDRPIVTGCVYNGANKTPYALPGNKTMTTYKSDSSKGGGGFNELRFEDKKGSEQIFVHAEKDMDVRVKKDQKELVKAEQHVKVDKSQYTKVGMDQHLTVTGEQNIKVNQNISRKAGMNIAEKAGMNLALQSGMQMHLKAGLTTVVEAGMMLTLKAGAGFITIGPTGVAISGPLVLINSGGAAGAGPGCNPTAPKAAKEAADAKPGQKMEKAKRPPRPKIAKYSPKAAVLKAAAASGTPFAQPCQ